MFQLDILLQKKLYFPTANKYDMNHAFTATQLTSVYLMNRDQHTETTGCNIDTPDSIITSCSRNFAPVSLENLKLNTKSSEEFLQATSDCRQPPRPNLLWRVTLFEYRLFSLDL